MKTLSLIMVLFTSIILASNNQYNRIDNIDSLNEYVAQNNEKDSWFAYQVKAQENTTSMCCWNNIDTTKKQCHLDRENSSFGSSNTDGITENINVYVKLNKGNIKRMITVGDQCEIVEGKQQVNWLTNITQQNSIKWLKSIAVKDNERVADNAVASLASHHGVQASKTLYEIANLNNQRVSSNAIFWLGNTRLDGVDYLQKLYNEFPNGHVKRHINFALSQSKDPQAFEMLKRIAINDKNTEQRADAYFWLAEKNYSGVEGILLNAIKDDPSHVVKEKAIFGLSQVKSDKAETILLDLVENSNSTPVKEKALFWLAQNSPLKAKEVVLNILKKTKSEGQITNSVFVLSQISQQTGDDVLFSLLTEKYSKQVKKQALFWLSQSDDAKTIDRLQNLL